MLIHQGSKTILTERLILRQFQYTDNEDMLTNWISDPDIQSMISEPVYNTEDEINELLDKYISSYERSDYYRWCIIEKISSTCIGQIAIFLVNDKNHFCEIEYALGKQFHRKGYATEAVKALLDFCFNDVHFHKVQVCHKEGNVASQGVIRKCNFIYEGTLRDFFYMDGKYVNRLYYSILSNEHKNIISHKDKPD
jgi:Acetyltransferases, including N-acetylases of ribosomal proteins